MKNFSFYHIWKIKIRLKIWYNFKVDKNDYIYIYILADIWIVKILPLNNCQMIKSLISNAEDSS